MILGDRLENNFVSGVEMGVGIFVLVFLALFSLLRIHNV